MKDFWEALAGLLGILRGVPRHSAGVSAAFVQGMRLGGNLVAIQSKCFRLDRLRFPKGLAWVAVEAL